MSQSSQVGQRKRKRSRSSSSHETKSDPTVINPLSHPPDVLKQFVIAGLSPSEPLPSTRTADFPHRRPADPEDSSEFEDSDKHVKRSSSANDDNHGPGPRRPRNFYDPDDHETQDVTEDDDEKDKAELAATSAERSRRRAVANDRAHERETGALVAIARRQLAAGDIARARRAFALLVRSRIVDARRVDLRRDGYWALGLDILRAEGRRGLSEQDEPEQEVGGASEHVQDADACRAQHWMGMAPSTNLDQVLAYLGALVRQFPNVKRNPNAVGAVDFYPALLGYEVTNIYGMHRAGLARAEAAAANWDEDMADDAQLDTHHDDHDDDIDDVRPDIDARQETLRRETDRLRLAALQRLRDIEGRMEELMGVWPYSRDHEMIRLRAMVALYTGDLLLPPAPRTPREDRDGTSARNAKRQQARELFLKIKRSGGDLGESWIENFVASGEGSDDDDNDDATPAMFSSSLPIR